MSDIIKLLPDSVANQIAAGEVIQRPASVVKELVENAVDARATEIEIILKDAGRTLIQVVDNGIGMSETDARLAFERHSTSKIRQASDLFSLSTMGFRGEALASIAAISHIELRTCAQGAQLGTILVINASHCESQEPTVCPEGCNFMVKDLFFNVPARRKFLKSNQVELSNIIKEFEKLALINHKVDFTLTHNGNVLYKFSGGSFKQRIAALFGRNIEQQLVPIATQTSLVNITGFVSMPEHSRKRNHLQFFFVNGRYMRHPYFHKAVLTSYAELIPDDAQPNYFLNFEVAPESIDVNIHPTKTEIKFENEMPIWQIVAAAVRESLGRFSAVPSIDFDNQDAPVIPAFQSGGNVSAPKIDIDPKYNPFTQSKSGGYRPDKVPTNWEELYRNFERKRDGIDDTAGDGADDTLAGTLQHDLPLMRSDDDRPALFNSETSMCLQHKSQYILSPIKSGLMVIDQHRAHVRVLYDRYIQQTDAAMQGSQSVMFPEVLHLTPAQSAILTTLEPDMERLGFSIAKLSGDDWVVNAVPKGLEKQNVNDVVQRLIDDTDTGGKSLESELTHRIALSLAKSAAIRRGQHLNTAEMEALLADLLHCQDPKYSPDGKKIIAVITDDQFAKMF